MARVKPNINIPSGRRDKQGFINFVREIVEDSFLFDFTPDELQLVNGELFILTLTDKKFIEDTLKVDVPQDYVKIYLYSIEQAQDRYTITQSGNNIVITFTEQITRLPQNVVKENFRIKGRITQV
jgi:hypothetical protein